MLCLIVASSSAWAAYSAQAQPNAAQRDNADRPSSRAAPGNPDDPATTANPEDMVTVEGDAAPETSQSSLTLEEASGGRSEKALEVPAASAEEETAKDVQTDVLTVDKRFEAEGRAQASAEGVEIALGRLEPDAGKTETHAGAGTRTPFPPASGAQADLWDSLPQEPPIVDVVVTGTRTRRRLADTPVATQRISQAEVRESGADNLQDLLEEVPHLNLERSFGRAGLQLRGLDSKYTLIVVDGQRLTGRVGGIQDLTLLPAEQVQQVELVRGAASMLYGADAIAGVVNIITRMPDKPFEARGRLAYGSRNTVDGHAEVGGQIGDVSMLFGGGYHRDDGFDLDPETAAQVGPGFEQFNLVQRAVWKPSTRFTLDQRASYVFRDASAVDVSGARAVLDRKSRVQTVNVLLRPTVHFSETDALTFRAGFSHYHDVFALDQRGDDALDQSQVTSQNLLELGAEHTHILWKRHLVTAAVEGFFEDLSTERLVDGRGSRGRFAALVQDEWTLLEGPRLMLVPGVRVDHDTYFGTYPSPRIAARFDPHKTLAVRAAYAWGFRAPNFQELFLNFQNPSAGYLVAGNPDLQPERAQTYDLNVDYQPLAWLNFNVAGFFNNLSNLIQAVPQGRDADTLSQAFVYENVESAYTAGLESGVEAEVIPGGHIGVSYTYVYARDRERARALAGRPRHRATAQARYTLEATKTGALARVAVTGARPFYQDTTGVGVDEAVFADAYALFDIRLNQEIGKHFRLFVMAENILGAGDAQFLPVQPRTFSAGIEGVLYL